MRFIGFYIPIFPIILIVSIAVLFFIEVGRVKRRNEYGLEVFKTATGAVAGGYLLTVAGRIARIGLVVGLVGTVIA